MFNKLKPGESEEDVLRMAQDFATERRNNQNFQPAATVVRVNNSAQKSIFAQKREQAKTSTNDDCLQNVNENLAKISIHKRAPTEPYRDEMTVINQKVLLDEIHENILGNIGKTKEQPTVFNSILGELVERVDGNKCNAQRDHHQENKPQKPKSIFAQKIMENITQKSSDPLNLIKDNVDDLHYELNNSCSTIIQDKSLSREIHAENMKLLDQMRMEDILSEQKTLLNSLDPSLIQLLTSKRKIQNNGSAEISLSQNTSHSSPLITALNDSSPAALELLQQSNEGNWLNFNLMEEHKLAWMRDIPLNVGQLEPGQQFNARFDWKGVLLPYTLQNSKQDVDERELYLHGEEPERPGYSLQELFRLARSTVLQQRISAFGAIAGIMSIYNQGFYDQVLTLPISKIFFLLRYGLDENTPAQLEVVSRALSLLFYNEADEVLLDHVYENAYCHWQPMLEVLDESNKEKNGSSQISFMKRYMTLLRGNSTTAVNADVSERQEDSRISDDFHLAETDLIECLLRTNICQRISFIVGSLRPENSTMESCFKLLIRIARTNLSAARQLVNETHLMDLIFSFYFNKNPISASVGGTQSSFYGQPHHLCLKLIRVLICQHLDIAKQLSNDGFIERLKGYLFCRDDIKGAMIRVQIEALRILRCLLLLGIVDRGLFKQFLPALRQMLDWHYNHCVFEVGGPALIRQHAAALIATLVAAGESGTCDLEAQKTLLEILHNCCCSWIHKATRLDTLKDYTQLTLLSAIFYAVNWFARNCYLGTTAFRKFLGNILPDFVRSPCLIACVQKMSQTSIILRSCGDRRNVHSPLPNVGAVLNHDHGPQLIVSNTYTVQMLSNLWSLAEAPTNDDQKSLFEALTQPELLEPLAAYLEQLSTDLNPFLASNFFARSELRLIHQLLTTDGLGTYLPRTHLLQLVFNYLCCLPIGQARQMKSIFERYIFNDQFIKLDTKSLELLKETCMDVVYAQFIADNKDPTLTICYTQTPALPADWPYMQLRFILNNYLQNVHLEQAVNPISENQVVRMTFTFVQQLELQGLQIVTPLEKLMYLMISFMGPDSQFLEPDLHDLLRSQILDFNSLNATYTFDFNATVGDKGNFEPLYYLFVNHFEAASYGDELFSALLLFPLAQKYDNKWRRRIWSEHVQALRFLNCNESLLIGGLAAYLEPTEVEPSLVKLYGDALERKLVRPGSIAYKIAQHHFNNSSAVKKSKYF
ncbi:RNA polymerase II-associated protein 1 [Drosophila busckii]|uniref:RNA polymerase II-associated protein 1 n=1 Tax=Drosophila busckii TaxID=30019 RepID=UPI0014330557|nr:RNA polymerase II-associated protein 1 [Drosophila busckii]